MRTREVIVCRECGKKHCIVEELFEHEEISMQEFARRYPRIFPANFAYEQRTARRFLITCQDCGEQYEFTERIEPLPHVYFTGEVNEYKR